MRYHYYYLNNFNPRYGNMTFVYGSDSDWDEAEKEIEEMIGTKPFLLRDRKVR